MATDKRDTPGTLKPAVIVGKATHEGSRKNNEDAFCYTWFETKDGGNHPGFLAMVADGIGGQAAGEEASHDAVRVLEQFFTNKASGNPLRDMEQGLIEAHAFIQKHSQENPELQGMGTTAAAVVVMEDQLYLAHVGDSRIFLIRGHDAFLLTADHTWAQEAIDAGRLSPVQARSHPNKNVITRYLGVREEASVDLRVRPMMQEKERGAEPQNGELAPREDLQPIRLQPGDVVVLCTDGLSDLIQGPEIGTVLGRREPQAAADQLVAMARARGEPNNTDNITVLVVEVPGRKRTRPTWMLALLPLVLILAAAAALFLPKVFNKSAPTPIVASITAPTSAVVVPLRTPMLTTIAGPATSVPDITSTQTPVQDAMTASVPETMATLLPTRTPAPTTPPPPTAAPQSTARPTASGSDQPAASTILALPPNLSGPRNGEQRLDKVTFSWQPAAVLPANAAYELVWWEDGASPDSAQTVAASTTNTSQEVDVNFLAMKKIRWTVLIVQPKPYKRLTQPTEGTNFQLQVCQMQTTTCTRTVPDPATGDNKTETYDCEKQVCP